MPISVQSLFEAVDLRHRGVVVWGERVPADTPGVYCVSTTADPRSVVKEPSVFRPSVERLTQLLEVRQHLTIDGERADVARLSERLGNFWLPDEQILYIGKAGSSLQKRTDQYYRTRIGARSPHAGGWWLKMVDGLEDMYVHFATCDAPEVREQDLMRAFEAQVSADTRSRLFDSERVAPFANVDVSPGLRKRHGLRYYKEDPEHAIEDVGQRSVGSVEVWSQPVTAKDRTRSYLRIPAASKHAFPREAGLVLVELDGIQRTVGWRPNGSRSGTLGLGVETMRSLGQQNERIRIEKVGEKYIVHRHD